MIRHGKLSRRQALAAAVEMLRAVGITDPARRAKTYPFEMSGGMCQRVMIAVALAAKRSLLIADEPTTGWRAREHAYLPATATAPASRWFFRTPARASIRALPRLPPSPTRCAACARLLRSNAGTLFFLRAQGRFVVVNAELTDRLRQVYLPALDGIADQRVEHALTHGRERHFGGGVAHCATTAPRWTTITAVEPICCDQASAFASFSRDHPATPGSTWSQFPSGKRSTTATSAAGRKVNEAPMEEP
jgi:ABC transporter